MVLALCMPAPLRANGANGVHSADREPAAAAVINWSAGDQNAVERALRTAMMNDEVAVLALCMQVVGDCFRILAISTFQEFDIGVGRVSSTFNLSRVCPLWSLQRDRLLPGGLDHTSRFHNRGDGGWAHAPHSTLPAATCCTALHLRRLLPCPGRRERLWRGTASLICVLPSPPVAQAPPPRPPMRISSCSPMLRPPGRPRS